MKRKNLIVILSLIITEIFITAVSTSYAYLKREVDTGKKVELIAGTLNYKIESSDLNNNRLIIPANSNKTITLKITSLNKIDSKYELYYKIITGVTEEEKLNLSIGYSYESIDESTGTINKNDSKTINVKMLNSISKDVEIEFGVRGGLLNNELVLAGEENKVKSPTKLVTGEEFRSIVVELAGDQDNIKGIRMTNTIDNSVTTRKISLNNEKEDILAYYDSNSQIIYISNNGYIYMNENAFKMCQLLGNLSDISAFGTMDISNTINMEKLFDCCSRLSNIMPVATWDTSKATNMISLFNCDPINNIIAVKNWDVSNVTNMVVMFSYNNISDVTPLANWNLEKVENLWGMFLGCGHVQDFSPLANWNISNVKDIGSLFASTSIDNLEILNNWDTSSVTTMGEIFRNCKNITTLKGLENWNTTKLKTLPYSFAGCTSLSDISALANWNTSNVTSLNSVFNGSTSISNLKVLDSWNLSSLERWTLFQDEGIFAHIPETIARPIWYY